MPASPAPRRPGWRSAGRILMALAGALLALVLLALGVGLVWLHSGNGRQQLASLVTHQARDAIKGSLTVRSIRVAGFLDLCVEGFELRDPEGVEVLRAQRLCVHVNPLALRVNKVLLSQVRLEQPWLDVAAVPGPDGVPTTTLARALAPQKQQAPAPDTGPLKWRIDVKDLALHGGSFALRPALGATPTFALDGLELTSAHASYAADGALAQLKLTGQLTEPGKAPLALDVDAQLVGAVSTGRAEVKSLRVRFGESGFAAAGSFDLASRAGQLQLRELVLQPDDVAALLHGQQELAGPVRGEADLASDGRTATARLRLQAGGGTVQANASSTLDFGTKEAPKQAAWSLELAVDHVDPGAVSAAAPHGEVTLKLAARGRGVPQLDPHGVRGELQADVHVGPARLDRVGPVTADLKARLDDRTAFIEAFTAAALGLKLKVHGTANYDALALQVNLDAPRLAVVGHAIGALTKKPSPPLDGTLQLAASVSGPVRHPQAQVHLRAPLLRYGPGVVANDLAVDGAVHGALANPSGELRVVASRFAVGQLALGAPRIDVDLDWPLAHLRVHAGVAQGHMDIASDATIDDDKDGVTLSRLTVSYPGNEFHLARPTNVHFRDETVLEPLELLSPHGSIRLSAQVAPERFEASAVVSKLELAWLPKFALPPGLDPHGTLDLAAHARGTMPRPDVDATLGLRDAGLKSFPGPVVAAQVRAHLHAGRLKAEGVVSAPKLGELRFEGDVPAASPRTEPLSTPLQLEVVLKGLDLERLSTLAHLRTPLQGTVGLRALASGTLGTPRATVSVEARDLATGQLQKVDATAGLLLEKGRATLDGAVAILGAQALAVTARAPFDLMRALREPGYAQGALRRPLTAEVAVSQLRLERLAQAGALPAGSSGAVSLALRLSGTPVSPLVQLDATGDAVSVGKLRGLDFQGVLAVGEQVKLTFGAQSQSAAVASIEASAGISGKELVALAGNHDAAAIEPLLDRHLSVALEFPGLVLGRAAALAGQTGAPAEGRLEGRIALTGTAARPQLQGHLALANLETGKSKLGHADLYVEGDSSGVLVHLGVDPPGGGNLLAHAQLKADLGGRTLLRRGVEPLLGAQLSGRVDAKHLDLGFLSGLLPTLRRATGTLDAGVTLAGVVSRPQADGNAHLRGASFDIVGQGVFQDVGLDAKFSPKEVVIDRLTGSTGEGTFAAVLVASMKPGAADGSTADKIELTGELHLGDADSVKGRKDAKGQPLAAHPVPIRQAGEPRAVVSGEINLFGSYSDGLLDLTAKIPDARVEIQQLPSKQLPNLSPNPDVLLVHPGEPPHPPGKEPEEVAQEAKARQETNFRLHAHLELKHLYVKAEDFEFPVESTLNLDYDAKRPDAPAADGTIHIPQGSFSALGRRFTIRDALITETGGDIADPELEVKAEFENPQATVTINVTGTAKEPDLQMTSNPAMDQDAIAFFLATGRMQARATQTGSGVDLSSAATSVLGGLLFGQVRKSLANVLPVDVLTIETGQGGLVSQASVGKYIGDRLYIGYRQRLVPSVNFIENTEEGRIEYELSRSLSGEAIIGDINNELSIIWTKDF
jgi:translocation and assembly module TamB